MLRILKKRYKINKYPQIFNISMFISVNTGDSILEIFKLSEVYFKT